MPEKRFVVVTGRPGVGKTTLVKRVVSLLFSKGIRFKGFYCPEVRLGGKRIGFRIESIDGSASGWLARVDGCDGPRVGRYTTCLEAESIVSKAFADLNEADLIVVDEIGPMELRLRGIREKIIEVLDSGKPALLVVHYRLSDRDILCRLREHGYWFEVRVNNRDELINKVYELLLAIVGSSS